MADFLGERPDRPGDGSQSGWLAPVQLIATAISYVSLELPLDEGDEGKAVHASIDEVRALAIQRPLATTAGALERITQRLGTSRTRWAGDAYRVRQRLAFVAAAARRLARLEVEDRKVITRVRWALAEARCLPEEQHWDALE